MLQVFTLKFASRNANGLRRECNLPAKLFDRFRLCADKYVMKQSSHTVILYVQFTVLDIVSSNCDAHRSVRTQRMQHFDYVHFVSRVNGIELELIFYNQYYN